MICDLSMHGLESTRTNGHETLDDETMLFGVFPIFVRLWRIGQTIAGARQHKIGATVYHNGRTGNGCDLYAESTGEASASGLIGRLPLCAVFR